jgi:transcriptional regulator with XRE-family HTH domain
MNSASPALAQLTSRRGLTIRITDLSINELRHPEAIYDELAENRDSYVSDTTSVHVTPTTFKTFVYDDPEIFIQELRTCRAALNLSADAMGARFGVIGHYWLDLEYGNFKNYDTELIKTICQTLGLRFNYLGFGGAVRHTAHDILNDLFARTVAIGLKLSELETYLGVSYQDLYKNILAGNLSPEHWQILTTKMRMRIKPLKQQAYLDDIGTKGIITELYRLQSLWDCSLPELANQIGMHPDTLVEMLHRQPTTAAASVRTCALFLGYRDVHTQASLPRIIGQYPNPVLAQTIEMQLWRLKWSMARLAQELNICDEDIFALMRNLKSTEAGVGECIRAQTTLETICVQLNIELITLATQPDTIFTNQNGWPEDAPLLWASIEETRKKLKLPRSGLTTELGISSATIYKFVAGDFSGKKRNTLIACARKFKHRFDSFDQLPPMQFTTMPSQDELTQIFNERFATSLIDRETLATYADTTPDRITFIMQGRVSLTNPLMNRVARILRVHLPSTNDKAKTDWLWQIDQALGPTNRAQKFAAFGLDEQTYARLMRGDFSFGERTVQYLGLALNIITPEFAQSVFDDLEDKMTWSTELVRRFKADTNSVVTLCEELGIDDNRWQTILSGHFTWHDEDITLLAERFKIYNRTLIQIMLEDNGGEHINGFAKDTGITSSLLDYGHFYRTYDVKGMEVAQIPAQRRQILEHVALQARVITPGETEFLKRSGGLPEEIPQLPLKHTHYLFSIGDVASATIYARHHGMESADYLAHYDRWLDHTYGLKTKNFDSHERVHLTGKRLDVHRNSFGLERALPTRQRVLMKTK